MATMARNAKVPMIDIGANLLDPMFRGIYREKQKHEDDFNIMLQRAFDVGVEKIIITSGNKEEAIKSGYLTSEEYEKFVDPKKMV